MNFRSDVSIRYFAPFIFSIDLFLNEVNLLVRSDIRTIKILMIKKEKNVNLLEKQNLELLPFFFDFDAFIFIQIFHAKYYQRKKPLNNVK